MKPLILALLLTFPILAVGQESKIIRQYDRFENRTRYWTEPAYMAFGLNLTVTFSFKGQGEGNEVEGFSLIFTSVSSDWKYIKNSRLYCLIDGKSVDLGSAKAANRDLLRGSESVKEVLMFPIKYQTLQTLTQAKQVEMRLGSTEFQIERYVISDIKKLLGKVKAVKR